MAKRAVSLDPDHRPWDTPDALVPLRQRKRRWPLFLVLAAALMGGVYLKESARANNAALPAPAAAPPTALSVVAGPPEVEGFQCPPPAGAAGYVTLVYRAGCAMTRLPCATYQVGERGGTTQIGPVIPVQGGRVALVCDGVAWEAPLP